MTTGVENVLGKEREVVALHRDKYVFPINLMARKVRSRAIHCAYAALPPDRVYFPLQVTQGGRQSFMGTIHPVEQARQCMHCSSRHLSRPA